MRLAVAELTETSHIERVAYPRVPVACLGKPQLQRRQARLNGAVMQKKKCRTGGKTLAIVSPYMAGAPALFLHRVRKKRLESGCSTNKKYCHRSSVLSLVSVLRIKVCCFPVSGEVTSYILPGCGAVTSHRLPVYGAVTSHSLLVYGAVTSPSLPIYGAVTSHSLPVYGAVTSHSLPVYGAVTSHSLPVYGAVTTHSLPVYDAVTSHSLPVYSAVTSHSLPVYGAVTSHNLPVYGAVTSHSLPFMVPSHHIDFGLWCRHIT